MQRQLGHTHGPARNKLHDLHRQGLPNAVHAPVRLLEGRRVPRHGADAKEDLAPGAQRGADRPRLREQHHAALARQKVVHELPSSLRAEPAVVEEERAERLAVPLQEALQDGELGDLLPKDGDARVPGALPVHQHARDEEDVLARVGERAVVQRRVELERLCAVHAEGRVELKVAERDDALPRLALRLTKVLRSADPRLRLVHRALRVLHQRVVPH